jgi:WASH complex subunit strumpellin
MHLQENVHLLNLDESFKESYQDIIKRFYQLFESIYKYYTIVSAFL